MNIPHLYKTCFTSDESIQIEGAALEESLQYIPSEGILKLRDHLKQLQCRIHGLNPEVWNDKDLVLTAGSQDGLSKVSHTVSSD